MEPMPIEQVTTFELNVHDSMLRVSGALKLQFEGELTVFQPRYWHIQKVIVGNDFMIDRILFKLRFRQEQNKDDMYLEKPAETVWYHNKRVLDSACEMLGIPKSAYRNIRARRNRRVKDKIVTAAPGYNSEDSYPFEGDNASFNSYEVDDLTDSEERLRLDGELASETEDETSVAVCEMKRRMQEEFLRKSAGRRTKQVVQHPRGGPVLALAT